jgi:hypothetical protein
MSVNSDPSPKVKPAPRGGGRRIAWTPPILAAIDAKMKAGVRLKVIAKAIGCSHTSLRAARYRNLNDTRPLSEGEILSRIARVPT